MRLMYNDNFSVNFEFEVSSPTQTVKEGKKTSKGEKKVVDIYNLEKQKKLFNPEKKVHSNVVVVFELETYNDMINAAPYTAVFFTVFKTDMRWDRDLTIEENENYLSHVKVFDGAHSCVTFMIDYLLATWKAVNEQIFEERFGLFKLKEKRISCEEFVRTWQSFNFKKPTAQTKNCKHCSY